jgi:hypothetical protein
MIEDPNSENLTGDEQAEELIDEIVAENGGDASMGDDATDGDGCADDDGLGGDDGLGDL